MNLQEFRRDCQNLNNSDNRVKEIIMQALRDEKITESKRDEFLEILKEFRTAVYAVVTKSLQRHSTRGH